MLKSNALDRVHRRDALWQALYTAPVITNAACADPQDCTDALGDMYDVYVCVPE